MAGSQKERERARPGEGDSDRPERAQSEVIGVVLLTGVVVVVVSLIGLVVLQGVSAESESGPTVDVIVDATTEFVSISHNGGTTVDVSSMEVVLSGESRARYPLSSFIQHRGSDTAIFEPGDRWNHSNDVGGDRLRVSIVHTPSGTVIHDVTVTPAVTVDAGFSYSPRQPTPIDTVTFDAGDSSVETGATIASYEWDFDGDNGTDATGETASHSFPDNGTYPVTLTVTTADGRTDNRTRNIRVYNVFPTASYTYTPSVPNPGQSVAFDGTNSTDLDGTLVSYEWDFDGNGTVDATGASATTSYDSIGDYTARLRVTDDDGAVNSQSQLITVVGESAPTVSITGTTITEQGNSGKYDITVTFEANDPDGSITNYTVTLYDSSSRTTQIDQRTSSSYDGSSTTVTVSDSGGVGTNPYYVVVRAGDSSNLVGEDNQTVDATNGEPTAEFDYSPTNPSTGQSVTFDASASTDPDGDSLTYEWDWTSDGSYDDTGVTAPHSYGTNGTYDVTLRVSDGRGGTTTETQTVVVGSGGTGPLVAAIEAVTDNSVDCNRNPGNNQCTGGSSPTAEFTVDWRASDSNDDLQSVTVELVAPNGTVVNNTTTAYAGVGSASASATLTHDPGQYNEEYTIRVTASNSTASDTDSRSDIADGN